MRKFLFGLRLFMQNRYGADQLYYGLTALAVALYALHFFVKRLRVVNTLVLLLFFAVIIYALFRVFSTNIEKRRRENDAFLRLLGRAKQSASEAGAGWASQQQQSRDKKHVRCPKCKADLRVPRQKGRHNVRCPRCNHLFKIRIFFGSK